MTEEDLGESMPEGAHPPVCEVLKNDNSGTGAYNIVVAKINHHIGCVITAIRLRDV